MRRQAQQKLCFSTARPALLFFPLIRHTHTAIGCKSKVAAEGADSHHTHTQCVCAPHSFLPIGKRQCSVPIEQFLPRQHRRQRQRQQQHCLHSSLHTFTHTHGHTTEFSHSFTLLYFDWAPNANLRAVIWWPSVKQVAAAAVHLFLNHFLIDCFCSCVVVRIEGLFKVPFDTHFFPLKFASYLGFLCSFLFHCWQSALGKI